MYNTNYNTNLEKINILGEKELCNLVKESVGMKRTPRNLDVFWAFTHIWRRHNKSSVESDTFLSTSILQNQLGICSRITQPYFNAWTTIEEEWSYTRYKCRNIVEWSPAFTEIMDKVSDMSIPKKIIEAFSRSVTPTSDKAKEIISRVWNKREIPNDDDYYVSTKTSPFRTYHQIQNIPKSEKEKIFNGMYDVDLEQAFGSIAWNVLNMSDCDLPYAWMLNPEMKNDFRKAVVSEFKLKTIDEAKTLICYLFSDKYKHSWGVEWFDNLHKEISSRVKSELGNTVSWKGNEEKINTFHKFFTYHEQMIMSNLTSREDINEVVNVHDGLISSTKPSLNTVDYLGKSYKLSVKRFGEV
jgi:hypothetical protein